MATSAEQLHVYDAVRWVDDAIRTALPDKAAYFVLGGIPTLAYRNPLTYFDHTTGQTMAGPQESLAASESLTVRANGTPRDIDILVPLVLSDAQGSHLKAAVERAVDNSLEVSVFGFDKHQPRSLPRKLGGLATAWMSRRTIDDDGVLRYELPPLQTVVPAESYEPWQLCLPNGAVLSVLNPAAHALAYSMRSISGLRHKDVAKVVAMRQRIVAEAPFEQAIWHGQFRSWLDFARAIKQTRDGELALHSRYSPGTLPFEIAAFKLKGRLLHIVEAEERIVNIAQRPVMQSLLKPFVGNH